ncbi:MAG: hypothetical protein RL497_89, partial [Pseudomonadota bacterium]
GPENIKTFEYSVLITSLSSDFPAIFQHYRDRADCENNFDESFARNAAYAGVLRHRKWEKEEDYL